MILLGLTVRLGIFTDHKLVRDVVVSKELLVFHPRARLGSSWRRKGNFELVVRLEGGDGDGARGRHLVGGEGGVQVEGSELVQILGETRRVFDHDLVPVVSRQERPWPELVVVVASCLSPEHLPALQISAGPEWSFTTTAVKCLLR